METLESTGIEGIQGSERSYACYRHRALLPHAC